MDSWSEVGEGEEDGPETEWPFSLRVYFNAGFGRNPSILTENGPTVEDAEDEW